MVHSKISLYIAPHAEGISRSSPVSCNLLSQKIWKTRWLFRQWDWNLCLEEQWLAAAMTGGSAYHQLEDASSAKYLSVCITSWSSLAGFPFISFLASAASVSLFIFLSSFCQINKIPIWYNGGICMKGSKKLLSLHCYPVSTFSSNDIIWMWIILTIDNYN